MTSSQPARKELPSLPSGSGVYGPTVLPPVQGVGFLHYLAVLLDYWWLVFLCLLVGAAIGYWRWTVQEESPTFSAGCRIEVSADSREGREGRLGASRQELVSEELERMTVILRTAAIKERVKAKLNANWAERLRDASPSVQITVDRVRGSESMLDITVDASDNDYALAYLTQLYKEYHDDRKQRLSARLEEATRNLTLERDSLKNQLDDARNSLATFQETENTRLTEAKAAFDEQFLAGLIQRENSVRMERTMLEGQLAVLADASTDAINELANLNLETHQLTLFKAGLEEGGGARQAAGIDVRSAVLNERQNTAGQEEELANLEAEYQDLMRLYKPTHPKMVALSKRMEQSRRALQISRAAAEERLRARCQALEIQSQSLKAAAESWKSGASLAVGKRTAYEGLRTTVEYLKTRMDQVYSRILDAGVAQSEPVYHNPVEPPKLRGPNQARAYNVMYFAVALALAVGIGLAMLLDYLDTSIRDHEAVEQRLGYAYLQGIPHWGQVLRGFKRKKDVVVVSRNRQNPATEVYRNLRGMLDGAIGEGGSYALLVTSAQAGDGKSMTSANLAVTFAWTGRRVLLVDGDLRRGSLHKAMALAEGKGLTDVLSGEVADWRTVAQVTEYPNLTFLAAGTFRRDAPELLQPARVRGLLDEFRASYDVIVLDGPPIGKVVEADLYGRVCDGTLLVTRSGRTRFSDVRYAARHLENANVLGFCVNGVEFSKKRYASAYAGESYDSKSYEREKVTKAAPVPVSSPEPSPKGA